MRKLTCILLVISVLGCSGPGETVVADAADTAPDTGTRGDLATDANELTLLSETTSLDLLDLWVFDGGPDVPFVECLPGQGCFLDPCQNNVECQSGWCLEHMGEGVCTQQCQEECPPGWNCQAVGTGPDLTFVCISTVSNLCKPCTTGADCKSPGGADDVCVDYAEEGAFCGGKCGTDDDCPWGFSCRETQTVEGIPLKQCVADAGVCPCTAKSASLGLSTPCQQSNDAGTCSGKRYCSDAGLTDCDAPLPADESCNGLDDNCDGEIDEATCNDDNACTQDACLGKEGCQYLPLTGTECIDGNPCTVADLCTEGICAGTPVACDDDNVCTDNSCDETGGCLFTPNTAPCDDANPCTVADACQNGACVGFPVDCECLADADCAVLEDGNVCNGSLVCDTTKTPHKCVVAEDSVMVCPAPSGIDAFCLATTCDPLSGACGYASTNDGFACDDGNLCTLGDFCSDGTCTSGPPVNCNDSNPCTDDSCQAGICQFTPNQAACEDGNACTLGDHCANGKCVKAGLVSCDDDNVCTTDSCDPDEGCLHLLNTAPCNDNNLCTTADFCQLGECTGAGALTCNDNNPCTDDACAPTVGCTFTPNTADCDDFNACTASDACSGGTCVGSQPLDCADDNVCTDDLCDAQSGCLHVNNSGPCSDKDACTLGDTCQAGICLPGAAIECIDNNPCTDDVCTAQTGCLFLPNTDPCDDGNACTANDVCGSGDCDGEAVQCNDNKVCTNDSCAPESGCVYSIIPDCCGNGITEAGEGCDDGNNTSGDGCSANCTSENTTGCADGSADQIFQSNVMVGCDGSFLGPQIALACGPGWHPANANEYFSYGGKTNQVSVLRWVDTAWDSQGKDVPLAQWQGYYDCSNSAGWNGLCSSNDCSWLSHTSECTLTFSNHDYGKSWGCHCRGGNPNITPHGVICVNNNSAKPRL